MRQTWELLTSRRMMFFVPVLIYTAISDAIYMSLLVPLLARTMLNQQAAEEKTQLACISMIFLGLGELVGSFMNGQIHDKIGTRYFALVNLIEMTIAYALLFWFNQHDQYTFGFAMSVCFFWGIQDSGVTNMWRVVCGFQFPEPSISFSVQQVVMAFFIFVMVYLAALVQTQTDYLVYFSLTGLFGVFAWLLFFWKFELKKDIDDEFKA